jgi:hypothetical protein
MPQSGIGYPSGALVSGNNGYSSILDGYIFASGVNKPTHSDFLTEKFGKLYTMTSLLDKLGAYEPVMNKAYSWSILDRTRSSATLGTVSGLPAATVTVTLSDVDATSPALGYFLVDDVVRSESGRLLKVTAVGTSGNFQTVTLARVEGGNVASPDIATGEKIGHAFTAFDEGSTGPNGRLFLPAEDYNYTQIFRRAVKVSRGAASTKSYLKVDGKEYWYFTNEKKMFEEFFADQERSLMFGVRTSVGNKTTSGGIWDKTVTQSLGSIVNYTTSTGIAESDFFTLIPQMIRAGCSKNLLLLAGSEAASDIQQALKYYTLNGGVNFGAFGNNKVGIDVSGYNFLGVNIAMERYPLFDDVKTLPFASTSTASKVNFKQAAIILDLGEDAPNITKMYRDGDAGSAKLIKSIIPGMVGNNSGVSSNSFDGWESQVLAELGWKVNNAHRFGAFVPNA